MTEEGRAPHVPVLANQIVEILQPKPGQTLLDLTVGYGGHAQLLLSKLGSMGRVIGVDQDQRALQAATRRLEAMGERFVPLHANFAQIDRVCSRAGVDRFDAILLDLGVSSPQLADPGRGFSFATDGPLDMRMDATADRPTAEVLLNELSESELADLIFRYGQERYSRRIARMIVRQRQTDRIRTTGQLTALIKRAYPRKRFRTHPATKTFQALRIAVNNELDNLETVLSVAPSRLNTGGRMAVISFHSLEDRLVKHRFRDHAASGRFRVVTRKPITATRDETRSNPRSRSAKLRALEALP